jgi:hypothetical protein
MSSHSKLLAITGSVSTLALICCCGCGGGNKYSYQDVTVTLSPAIPSIMVNGTQTFTATAHNAPDFADWYLQNVGGGIANFGPGSPNAGTMTTMSTDAPTMIYTAPPTPPIYDATAIAAGAVQGSVTITAFVANNPANVLTAASASQTFVITAPSVTVGLSPATVSVNVGKTQQFTGYAVGSVNNLLTWQVNGVAGGASATGSITTAGLYTAPTVIPITGSSVTVGAVSQADPTKNATCVVTLTQQ